MNWHSLSKEEILKTFKVDPTNGLDNHQVKENRERFGKNLLPYQKPKPGWVLFLEQFNNPIIYILIIAAILNAILSGVKDTFVIAGVITVNAILGYIQERRASDALRALRQMAAPLAKVIRSSGLPSIRSGEQQFIETSEVVCGDIIVLESGMCVPADARLIETQNLLVDESMLTGESFSITKKAEAVVDDDAGLGDRLTMVFSGTVVNKGRAKAIVTSVGPETEIGKISRNVEETEETVSPLQTQIEKFGRVLSYSIVAIVIIIFATGFLRGNNLVTMFLTSVALAVSAIPEGLPISVTVTLSIGIYQMAKYKAIVKKLAAVETLGSTNVICSDKTGTLTKNQMTTARVFTGGEEYRIIGSGYEIEGEALSSDGKKKILWNENPALEKLSLIGALCTETTITKDNKEWKITGDPTEGALQIACEKLGFSKVGWSVDVDIPFESENQLMAVRVRNGDSKYVFAKGAPEKMLHRSITMLKTDGSTEPINADELRQEIKQLSESGLRVLALAYYENLDDEQATFESLRDMTFAGFAAIEDSVRPEAVDAVTECYKAGIRVAMITGDHPQTAQAVAKSVGIAPLKDKPSVLTGKEIDGMSDDELFVQVRDTDVYARVAPNHKFRIVKQLQRNDNTVAMTGDGVNDAPALKQADIGIAMGSGTDVAKESSSMVLMDDNFATIVQAVRRGRVILHNLQHIMLYILATSFGGVLTIAMSIAVGFPVPLLPAQLLWINMVTDGTSTVPFAFEKEHGNVMAFAPRKKNAPLVTKAILVRIVFAGIVMMLGTLGVYYIYAHEILNMSVDAIRADENLKLIYMKAQTMAFCILAFFQIWNVQNSRSIDRSIAFNLPHLDPLNKQKKGFLDRVSPLRNPALLGVMLLAMALQISAVTIPAMNVVFDTVPLSVNEWLTVILVSFSIVVLVEIIKFIESIVRVNKERIKVSKV